MKFFTSVCLYLTIIFCADDAEAFQISKSNLSFDEYMTTDTLVVENDKSYPITLKIAMQDYIMNEKGRLMAVDAFPYSLKPYLSILEDELIIPAGQQKKIKLSLQGVYENKGDLHTHLILKSNANETVRFEMGLPVVYKIELNLSTQVSVVSTQDGLLTLYFEKSNQKAHEAIWVEIQNEQGGNLVPPFIQKLYREVKRIERSFTIQKPEPGKYNIKIYDLKDRESPLNSYSFTIQ
jgi:hypothetical protein